LADTETQNRIEVPENAMTRPEGDWDLIHGELMTFTDPCFDLPPIDRMEGFGPNGFSMYERVLVTAKSQERMHACWAYFGLEHILQDGIRLPDGCWIGNTPRKTCERTLKSVISRPLVK
jgi:hypothetical protein